jgi:hypothetical protein
MTWAVEAALRSETAASLRASGADMSKVEAIVKAGVLDVTFNLCYLLDEPDGTSWTDGGRRRSDIEPSDPRWALCEAAPDGSLTGRPVDGLHESVQEIDPDGNEGQGWVA